MTDDLRVLQKEVDVLKTELENLTKDVANMYNLLNKDVEVSNTTKKASGENGEPNHDFENGKEYLREVIVEWKQRMGKQLEEQGFPPEEVDNLLTRIQNQYLSSDSKDFKEDIRLSNFRTDLTEKQRKLMEETESNFGVIVNTVENKGPGSYSVWGALDTQKKFLNFEPLSLAQFFAVFSNDQRLLLLKTLFENGEMTAAQLQEKTGIAAGGQFYHHLKEIASIGLLAKTKRGSYALSVYARAIIATLFAIGINVPSAIGNDIALMVNMMEGMTALNPFDVYKEGE